LLKFGRHKTTNQIPFNFLLPELWIFCAPLTWQEQENMGRKAYLAALPEALPFLRLSRL